MKNAFDGLICGLDTVEEKNLSQRYISKILTLKIKNWEKQTLKGIEQNIQGMWGNYNRNNIYIMGIPEGEEREKRTEEIQKITVMKICPS